MSHILGFLMTRPRGYKTWVQSQTQNKAQWLAACGHKSTSSQSLRFVLSLRMNSSFITSRPVKPERSRSYRSSWNSIWYVQSKEEIKSQESIKLSTTQVSCITVPLFTDCRPTQGTVRKSHIKLTAIRHKEDSLNKATSSLDCKARMDTCYAQQNKDQQRALTISVRLLTTTEPQPYNGK